MAGGGWSERIRAARIFGVTDVEGWSFAGGGAGQQAGQQASAVLIRLDGWAAPILAREEVIMAEQPTRAVARSLQPLLRLLAPPARWLWQARS